MTTIHGPPFWDVLHFAAHHYNPSKREAMKCLFRAYTDGAMPCGSCTKHFSQMLQEYPYEQHLESRESLVKYVNEIHNRVNQRLNKRIVSVDESYYIYAPPYTGYSSKNFWPNLAIFSAGATLGILTVFFWLRHSKSENLPTID